MVANQDAPDFPRRELRQPKAEPGVMRDPLYASDNLPHDADSGRRMDGLQELVKANQIRVRLARPAERHELAPAGPFGLA